MTLTWGQNKSLLLQKVCCVGVVIIQIWSILIWQKIQTNHSSAGVQLINYRNKKYDYIPFEQLFRWCLWPNIQTYRFFVQIKDAHHCLRAEMKSRSEAQ